MLLPQTLGTDDSQRIKCLLTFAGFTDVRQLIGRGHGKTDEYMQNINSTIFRCNNIVFVLTVTGFQQPGIFTVQLFWIDAFINLFLTSM